MFSESFLSYINMAALSFSIKCYKSVEAISLLLRQD